MHTPKKRISRVFTKMLCWVLLVAMCLSVTTGLVFTANAATSVTDWTASEITLTTADDLIAFANQLVADNTFADQKITLGADIDLNPGWVACKTAPATVWPDTTGKEFQGVFDGQGYTIRGIHFTKSGENGGIFGNVTSVGAMVQNFTLLNSYITSTSNVNGTLFGLVSAPVTIDGVYLAPTMYVASTGSDGQLNTGGFVGKCSSQLTITNSVFAGSIEATKNRPTAGFLGRLSTSGSKVTYENCAFYGIVKAGQNWSSGFTGISESGTSIVMNHCIATGYLQSKAGSAEWDGMLAGNISASVDIKNTVYTQTYFTSDQPSHANNALVLDYIRDNHLYNAPVGFGKYDGTGIGWKNIIQKQDELNLQLVRLADIVNWVGETPKELLVATGMIVEDNEEESSWVLTSTLPLPKALKDRDLTPTPYITRDTAWYDNHTDQTTYNLATASQLLGFSDLMAGGTTFAGKTVKLAANIDVNPGWSVEDGAAVINVWGNVMQKDFFGSFDGTSHSVSGVFLVNATTDPNRIGMFGRSVGSNTASSVATEMYVKDFTLKNSYIGSYGNGGVGLLFGEVRQVKLALTNVHVEGTAVSNVAGDTAKLGAVIGCVENGSGKVTDIDFYNVTFDGTLRLNKNNNGAGGFIGRIYNADDTVGSVTIDMKDCSSEATVISTGYYLASDPTAIGGFIGDQINKAGTVTTIEKSESHCVLVTADQITLAGAFVGEIKAGALNLTNNKNYTHYPMVGNGEAAADKITEVGTKQIPATAIGTAEELLAFAQRIADGYTFEGEWIELTADIDLNPDWVASKTAPANVWPNVAGKYFEGTIDGNGHTISGAYLSATDAAYNGLFGNVPGGNSYGVTVKDLAIVNSYIATDEANAGALFGTTEGNTTITNVYLDVDMYASTTSSSPSYVDFKSGLGGVVGTNNSATLSFDNVVVVGDIYNAQRPTGGFVGWNDFNSAKITFVNCAFYGNLWSAKNNTGGFVGRNWRSVIIDNCISVGEVRPANYSTDEQWQAPFVGATVQGTTAGREVTITNSIYTQTYKNADNAWVLVDQVAGVSTGGTFTSTGNVLVDKKVVYDWVGATPSTQLSAISNVSDETTTMADNWTTVNGYHPLPNGVLFAKKLLPATLQPDISWYDSGMTYFDLYDEEDLLGFATLLADGTTFSSKTIRLQRNMNLNPGWVAGADAPAVVWPNVTGNHFRGTFDGQGHTLSGIHYTATGANGGIFGVVTSGNTATIKNLALVNSYVHSDYKAAGIFLGTVQTSSATANFTNVYTDATLYSGYTASNATEHDHGGFVGRVNAGIVNISNCVMAGTVTAVKSGTDSRPSGGFIGRMYGSSTVTITDSAFYGTIRARGNRISGFVGYAANGVLTIDRCISVGHVQAHTGAATSEWQGSFVGHQGIGTDDNITVTNSIYSDVYYYDNDTNYTSASPAWDNTATYGQGYRPLATAVGTGSNGALVNSDENANLTHMDYTAVNAWIGSTVADDLTTAGMTDTWTQTDTHPIPSGLSGIAPAISLAAKPITQIDTSWYNESADTFTLTTADQLLGLSWLIKGGTTFANKSIILGADIDLNPGVDCTEETPWAQPWANVAHKTFLGNFDGQGHTVSGVYLINNTTDYGTQKTGMLGFIYGGTTAVTDNSAENPIVIQNFTLTNSYIKNQSNGGVGSVIGEVRDSHVAMSNVHSDANVVTHIKLSNTVASNSKAGGLVGAMESAGAAASLTMTDCSFSGTVTSGLTGGYPLGGLIGIVYRGSGGTATLTMTNCESYATITSLKDVAYTVQEKDEAGEVIVKADEGSCVGGLIGKQSGSSTGATVSIDGCTSDVIINSPILDNENNTIGAAIGLTHGTLTITNTRYSTYNLVGLKEDSAYGVTNTKKPGAAKWIGYQTTASYTVERDGVTYEVFDLRLLAVVNNPNEDVKAYCFALSFDGVSKGYVRSSVISTEVTAYTAGTNATISASEYGGTHFAYVHIKGVPADGTAPEIMVNAFTQYMDGTEEADEYTYVFTPAAFASN